MQNNDKLLLPKIIDKIKLSKNKITNSEFLNEYQISMVEKELRKTSNTNFFFEGGYEDAESKILVAYPETLGESIARKIKETRPDGTKVYQDTNNTSNDFEVKKDPQVRRYGAKVPSWNTWINK